MLNCDSYFMPTTLKEALALWASAPDGSRIVAGATDLLPWAREGRAGDVHVPQLIDVSRIGEFNQYELTGGRVRLGANIVYQRFLTDGELRRHMPCMPYCAIWFADDQIREQATLAGNLVNASPAADGTPPVVAMNGEVEIAKLVDGRIVRHTLAVEDFITGPGMTALQAGEIVTAVVCDSMLGYGGSFEKVGLRRSLVISVVCTTALVKPSEDQSVFEDVRLAMGGTGPVPMRLREIEAFLKGRAISFETLSAAGEMTDGLVQSRSRQGYRKIVAAGFIIRALQDALADVGIKVGETSLKEKAHV